VFIILKCLELLLVNRERGEAGEQSIVFVVATFVKKFVFGAVRMSRGM